ncbi:MAG: VOC family protein [Pedobacter sp.]|nr:VOC family protein [Pedobacter sp.]
MESLNPYIDFSGKCREALAFYKNCFGGEVVTQMTYADAKVEVPEPFKDYLLHSEFQAPGVRLMASDGHPGQPATPNNFITLCLHCSHNDEQTRVFDTLATGGNVVSPLAVAFWGDRFGMVTDRFGVNWMLICAQKN